MAFEPVLPALLPLHLETAPEERLTTCQPLEHWREKEEREQLVQLGSGGGRESRSLFPMSPLPTVFDLEPGIYKMVGLVLLTATPRCADEERKLRDARAFFRSPKKPAWSPAHLDPGLPSQPLPSAEGLYLVLTDVIIRFPQCWGSQRYGGPGESLFPCLLQLPKATASLATASNLVSQLSFVPTPPPPHPLPSLHPSLYPSYRAHYDHTSTLE